MREALRGALRGALAAAAAAGLPADPSWMEPLGAALELLARFNVRTNLVGDASPRAVVAEHVVEALTVAGVVARSSPSVPGRVADVGAGAGLEGIVLALCWPEARIVAVEPRRRRAAFIELAADAAVVGRRLRVLPRDLRGARLPADFDLATSRAVFAPERWPGLARPLLRDGGLVALHVAARRVAPCWDPARWSEAGDASVPGRPDHRVVVLRAR